MSAKLLALVKWIGGVDDKKYTVGIPVEWIRDFNEEDFRSEKFDPDENYIVEWRDKPSPPPGGWRVYDAYVIEVSNRKSVLEKKVQALDGFLSPTKCMRANTPPACASDDNLENLGNNIPIQNNKVAGKTLPGKMIHQSLKRSAQVNKTVQEKTTKQSKQHLGFSSESESGHRSPSRESGLRSLSPKRKRRNVGVAEPEKNLRLETTLKEIQNQLTKIRKKQSSRRGRDDSSSDSSSDDEMVEIGPRGSDIFITKDQWLAAKSASTFTAMGLSLLLSLFPLKVLLKSNLRGGKSKVKGTDDDASHRKALNPKVVDAIYYAVRKRWKTFDHTRLGTSINNKLNHLRAAHAKKNLPTQDPRNGRNNADDASGKADENDDIEETA